jgi:pilus assembly protein CpaC
LIHTKNVGKDFSIVIAFLFLLATTLSFAADSSALNFSETDEVSMIRGELVNLTVDGLTRISITDPDVADITTAEGNEVTLIGKNPGQTTLFIWDANGKQSMTIHVSEKDLNVIKDRLKKLLKNAAINEVNLEVNEKEGKVVASGELSEEKQELFEQIIVEFPSDVINLVKKEQVKDLIQIDLQISELNETLDKALGIDWGTGSGNGINLNYKETLPDFDGTPGDFFKIGDFARTSALQATVNAIIREGKGRILSKPKLVVENGEQASFLVGGEIPIRTTTSSSGGSTQENVSFKEYGVGMTITPTIRTRKIEVKLVTEISDIDPANKVGNDVAFTTRSAQTQVILDDGQLVVIAGLIRSSQSETVRRVPFLSKVPVMGLLFRSRETTIPNQDTEIAISMTPHVLSKNRSWLADKQQADIMETQTKNKHAEYVQKAQAMGMTAPRPFYAGIPPEMAQYVSNVQQKISQSIVYPKEAKDYGWEGTVKVAMLILNDGTLAYALVKESSGYDLFDEYALKTAKNIAPYDNFPTNTNLQELNVTIPIVYSLKK